MPDRTRFFLRCAALAVCALGAGRPAAADHVSALTAKPDWSELTPFQKSITKDEFLTLLNRIYAPDGAWKAYIDLTAEAAVVHAARSSVPEFRLEFARSSAAERAPVRYWAEAGTRKTQPGKPLAGYTIALDPGHLGGRWAQMEERWFKIGDSKPVTEGDMALIVARLLADRLTASGANVVYVRKSADPVTSERPGRLRGVAVQELQRQGITRPRNGYNGPNDPLKQNSITWQSELLFYRVSEIRSRAEVVNRRLKPDLVICLHFNAEEWGNPAKPVLTDKNHLHLLMNGNCGPGELGFEDIRHDMLLKLLNRTAREEVPLSIRVAASLASATGLPPFIYHGKGLKVSSSPYVWARNLLATRLYQCPVVYCEPYVMNSQAVFDRVQAGDYEGTRVVGGASQKSIFREYADAVADGVTGYFAEKGR